jgi:protein-S-isoprenylcysteine O-methyltransferase Ste14
MNMLQLSTQGAFVACFGSFTWAAFRFFRIVDKNPNGGKVIVFAGALFLVLHLLALSRPGSVQGYFGLAGLGFYGISFLLFWSTLRANRPKPLSVAFSQDQPEHLMREGPYRYIRHPFYASYLIAWLAGAVACQQPWLLATFVIMTIIYTLAARVEESKFAASPLAGEYASYRRGTGMFLPSLFRLGAEIGRE